MRNLYLSLSMVIGLLAGCRHGDPLAKDENIGGWANASSALGAFTTGYDPIAFASGDKTFTDTTCPATTDDGTTATITGGCVASDGVEWFGAATVVRGAAGALTLTLDGYGNDALLGPSHATGTVAIRELAADRHAFDVDVTSEGGITTDVQYSGTVVGTTNGPTTWNGSGTISRDGDFFDGGTIEATTVDQLRDNSICPGEGLSGRTTMTSDAHTVVIDYDGATDCDGHNGAHWSRDGHDQGVVTGITCSAGGPGGLGMVALVTLAACLPRRRRSPACSVRTSSPPA